MEIIVQHTLRRAAIRRALIASAIASLIGLAVYAPQAANAGTVAVVPGQSVVASMTFANTGAAINYGPNDNRTGVFTFNAPAHTKYTGTGTINLNTGGIAMAYEGCAPANNGQTLTCTGWKYTGVANSTGIWNANGSVTNNSIFLAVDADAPSGTYVGTSVIAVTASRSVTVDIGVNIARSYAPTVTRPLVDQNGAAGETLSQSQNPIFNPNAPNISSMTVSETADSNVILEPTRAVGDTWTINGSELRKLSDQRVDVTFTTTGGDGIGTFAVPAIRVAPATVGAQAGSVTARVTTMTDANGPQATPQSASTAANYTWAAPVTVDSPMVNPAVGAMGLLVLGIPAAVLVRRRFGL